MARLQAQLVEADAERRHLRERLMAMLSPGASTTLSPSPLTPAPGTEGGEGGLGAGCSRTTPTAMRMGSASPPSLVAQRAGLSRLLSMQRPPLLKQRSTLSSAAGE